jgi:predicted tellurium resistance membrane protein TerC
MRYGATLFSSLLERFPHLETSAYLLIGWIGIKLGGLALGYPLPPPLFWTVTALLFLLGFFRSKR